MTRIEEALFDTLFFTMNQIIVAKRITSTLFTSLISIT